MTNLDSILKSRDIILPTKIYLVKAVAFSVVIYRRESWTIQKAVQCQSCPTLCNPKDCSPPGSSAHGDSPGKNTEVGCHALLQGIFPTQGSNLGLPHSRQTLYHLSHLDTILKSRDIILPTKVHIVKAMVFPVAYTDVIVGP